MNKKDYVYLITLNDQLQLPIGCFDTLKDCSNFLLIPRNTLAYAIYRGSVVRNKYLLFKVEI